MATVLKSEQAVRPSGPQGAAVFNLEDLAEQGQRHVRSAEQRAQQILQQAEQEARTICEQARAAAHREGVAAAELEIRERVAEQAGRLVAQQLPQLTSATEALRAAEEEWLTQWQATTVQLAVAIAEKLVQRELTLDQQVLTRWFREAIDSVRAGRQVCVCIHPETLAQRGEELEALIQAADLRDAVIQADETVPDSGIVIRQESGRLELSLRSQLERLAEQLQPPGAISE